MTDTVLAFLLGFWSVAGLYIILKIIDAVKNRNRKDKSDG